jgi:hypothetical protein
MGEVAIRRSGGQARLCVLSPFGVLSLPASSFHSFLNNRGGQCLLISPMIARLFQYLFSVHSLLFSG